MSDNYNIDYVPHASINPKKWDECIDNAENGLIYAYSTYLDHMSKHWDALILDDYKAVMPLTWNKKWGIKYLYQPPLTQQLGVFSTEKISNELIDAFVKKINAYFKFAEIFFNYANPASKFKPCHNYRLHLNDYYDNLSERYSKMLLRNLKKATSYDLKYVKHYDLKKALHFHQQQYGHKTPHVRNIDYIHFENLCFYFLKNGETIIRAVSDAENELLSVAVLLVKNGRMYLVEPTTFDKGRTKSANHFLLNEIIREFSEKNIILDFVGSDIPGIAQYYENFGPTNEPYFFYRLNNLPWPLKLFKR